MKQWKGILQRLRTPQSDHIQLLILIPSLTLVFLSLIVRTASSAIDPTLEKKKVTEQLRQRLSEVQNDQEIRVTLTVENSTRKLEEEGVLKWVPSSCSASPSLPNQCIVSDPERETGAWDLIYGSELGKAQDEPSPLTPHERKEAKGTTLDLSFRVLVPGHVRDKLARRIVSLTIAFEQGGVSPAEYFGTVSGDFDGQGLSFGILQWNLGSCSLQPLLEAFRRKDNARFQAIMETDADFMEQVIEAPCDEAPSLARSVMLDANGQVKEPWITRFGALGRERGFQEVQVQYMLPQVQKAYSLADEFGFHSERAVALFFDILVQNGGIPLLVRTQYEQDIQDRERSLGRALDEVERMKILANHQAEAANPKWVDTVRARKLTIVDGEGSVNGITYNLDALGIRLRDYKTGKAVSLNNGEDALKQLEQVVSAFSPIGGEVLK
jgi:hypothetical protein